MLNKFIAACVIALAVALPSDAQNKIDPAAFEASLSFETGKVELADGALSIELPRGYRFLSKRDAKRVLTEVWENQVEKNVLGMVMASDVPATHPSSWGIVIAEDKLGHVHDSDTASLDPGKLMDEMRAVIAEQNAGRKKAGVGEATLIGWVTPPVYDKDAKTLSWASEFAFEGATERHVSHQIHLLGRENVVSMHTVGSFAEKDRIGKAMRDVSLSTTFNTGARYADYNNLIDKNAPYDMAAIVRGETLYFGKSARFWADLKHFNLVSVFTALIIAGVVVWQVRAMIAKLVPGTAARSGGAA